MIFVPLNSQRPVIVISQKRDSINLYRTSWSRWFGGGNNYLQVIMCPALVSV